MITRAHGLGVVSLPQEKRDVLQIQAGGPAWLGLWTRSFLGSVPPSSGACAWRTALSTLVSAPTHSPAAPVGCEEGHPSPTVPGRGLPSPGMGTCLAGWRRAGSCAVTHLRAPATALDEGPRPLVIPARGDIEFSVCFASVIGQDAVKGGESAQGRGVKEIGKHY